MDKARSTTCGLKETRRAELLLDRNSATARDHFEGCAVCQRASVEQAALWTALDSWSVPAVTAEFNRNLYARIDAAAAQPWYERFAAAIRPTFAKPALAMGLVCVLTVAGFVLDHQSLPPNAGGSAGVQVSSTEAEQLEKTLDDLEMLRQFDPGVEEKENTSKSM